ncbi:hypothetical protein C8R43DRAFT_961435 [Mycena crocata]|nr:hypothetical protein C8R43DRAFT_961435 [Mycena crocata]
MSSTDKQNIAIIGGGPGGLRVSMAAILQKAGFSQAMYVYCVRTRHTQPPGFWAAVSTCTSSLVWYRCNASCGTEKQFRAAASSSEGESTGVPRATVHHDHRRRRAARRSRQFHAQLVCTTQREQMDFSSGPFVQLNLLANALGRHLHGSPSPTKQENSLWKGFRVVREVFVCFPRVNRSPEKNLARTILLIAEMKNRLWRSLNVPGKKRRNFIGARSHVH